MGKICKGCKLHKEADQFNKAKGNRDGLTGKCKSCLHLAWKSWYYGGDAKDKNAERNRRYSQTEKGKANTFRKRLARFNLTEAEYRELEERSEGYCESCKERLATDIDHCHNTGRVRGLLCGNCNTALGLMADNPIYLQRAIEYLKGD
jgi:hypothetical protein